MPELPEVETVCRGLSHWIKDKVIKSFSIIGKPLRFPYPQGLEDLTTGCRIAGIRRTGKYIRILLHPDVVTGGHEDAGLEWLVHLGMTGHFRFIAAEDVGNAERHDLQKHDHVEVVFEDGSRIIYQDVRRFGFMDLYPASKSVAQANLAVCGYDPFDKALTGEVFYNLCQQSSMPIKNFLLVQKFVCGIGNIYASESLFLAKIHPLTPAKNIHRNQAALLLKHVRDILTRAIDAGGSTIQDFKNTNGKGGYFQFQWQVYGRERKECTICDGVIENIRMSGRSSFYCPNCQRA